MIFTANNNPTEPDIVDNLPNDEASVSINQGEKSLTTTLEKDKKGSLELNSSQNQFTDDITKKMKPEEVVTREREIVDQLYSNVKTQ